MIVFLKLTLFDYEKIELRICKIVFEFSIKDLKNFTTTDLYIY